MKDLKVTIIQSPIDWEDIDGNLGMFSKKIESVKEPTDLLVLPEMFNTGFTMNAVKLSENINGKTRQWMQAIAKKKKCVVTGSIIVESSGAKNGAEKKEFFNRLIWQSPDGHYDYYDKKHLFRYANEQDYYTAGNKKLIVELNGWKICPMICYDLRFPVWIRNYQIEQARKNAGKNSKKAAGGSQYDVLIFVANWPEKRRHPWKTLLRARAIENQCYVIGVNRIGKDGNNFSYSGDSMVVNPMGEIISNTKPYKNAMETITLSKSLLEGWRKSFPAWKDADEFNLT